MRAALYGRVSTDEQAQEGFSIAAQKEKLSAYAHSQDWHIFDFYFDEGVSGKHTERPELQRLLADLRHGKLDVVLVYRLDRLTRSVLDLYQLLQEFDQYKVCFASATEVYDTTTAIGRLFITLVAALAQWERENLAERVKLGMEQMALEQKRPGGPPPYGYRRDQDGGLLVQPEEAAIVREIYDRYVRGSGVGAIAKWLNNRGIMPRHAGRWAESTLLRILRNHVYFGALRWNYADKNSSINPPDQWILHEHVYEPIVSKEVFAAVQDTLWKRKRQHPRQLASDYVFSGLLWCGQCQRPMVGKTGRITRNEKSYAYRFYHCSGKRTGSCAAPLIREDKLCTVFAHAILHMIADEHKAAQQVWADYVQQAKRKQSTLLQELEKTAARKQRWQLAYLDQIVDEQELRAGLMRDRQQESQLQAELASMKSLIARSDAAMIALLQDLPRAWEVSANREKKQLASLLIERLYARSHKREVSIERVSYR
ncbi:MAG: recombinase family protein [Clostridia bacterium]